MNKYNVTIAVKKELVESLLTEFDYLIKECLIEEFENFTTLQMENVEKDDDFLEYVKNNSNDIQLHYQGSKYGDNGSIGSVFFEIIHGSIIWM